MDWNKDLAADLPAPRDDEPPSLRDDIVAELQDHLACAMNRERHATGDDDRAQKNVIEKFGNPAAIASRLWWDAMKENIMSQRVMMVASSVMAIACLAASGFAWQAVQESRAMNQAMLESNRLMMEKLSSLSLAPSELTSVATPDPLDWVPVQLKLVLDRKDGLPAEGYKVKLKGNLFGGGEINVEETSGADGTVDFGYVKPGACQFRVSAPWGDYVMQDSSLVVMPGTPLTKTVVCPSAPVEELDVKFNVNWPADLAEHELGLVFYAMQDAYTVDGEIWSPTSNNSWPLPGVMYAYEVNAANDVAAVPVDYSGLVSRGRALQRVNALTPRGDLSFVDRVTMKRLPLNIHSIAVVMPTMERLGEYIDMNATESLTSFPVLTIWPSNGEFGGRRRGGRAGRAGPSIDVIPPSAIPDESTEPLRFEPQPGVENVWTIELPEALIARTGEALAVLDEFKAAQDDSAEAKREGN